MTNWIDTLSTQLISADMAAAAADGVVTYNELLKLFSDVEATLAQTGRMLSAAEFADLRTIAANLNNGMSTSDYLVSITQSLVDGNLANAVWTGGQSASVPLGNLAAGSSATQLDQLVGKWFLGTDLPGTSKGGGAIIYSAFNQPLFGPDGPVTKDINEGYIGDCYFLACLAEIAGQHPDAIASMFTDNGNGTYGVRFYIDGAASYVTVDNQLWGGTAFPLGNNNLYASAFPGEWGLWGNLLEKALAQLQATTTTAVNGNGTLQAPGNSWDAMGNGGADLGVLEELTGASTITLLRPDFSTGNWVINALHYSLGSREYGKDQAGVTNAANATAFLIDALAAGNDVVFGAGVDAYDAASGLRTLVGGHEFSVLGYDAATEMFIIRNPWGMDDYYSTSYSRYASDLTYLPTFEMSLDMLFASGCSFSIDNANRGFAPLLAQQTEAQNWAAGQTVNFTLAAKTFIELESQTLIYSATLADGSALPSWLKFDPTTGTFTGTVASTATDFAIKVTATDSEGLSTSETFNVAVPSIKLAAQTPTQYWTQAVNFTLPSNTFSGSNSQKFTYMATLADGSSLPSWLEFDSATGTFTGTPPGTPSALDIKVTATDASGLQGSETFSVYALAGATLTTGTAGSDRFDFSGTPGNNIITGGFGGSDVLAGGAGNNILVSAPGNYLSCSGVLTTGNNLFDGGGTIRGGGGNDVYIIRRETFASDISDLYGGQDMIIFKDINPEDVTVRWSSDGLHAIFQLIDTGAQLTLEYQTPNYVGTHIEQFVFADGTVWDYSQLLDAAASFTWVGSASSPTLTGNELGTNTFQFGAGHEVANGGERSNIYQVSASTGQAEIRLSTAASSKNELDFMAGITDENLWFKQSGNNLEIDILGTNTSVTIDDWFSGSAGALQTISAGGLKIDSQISQLVQAMATYSAHNPGFNPASSSVHTLPGDSALQSTLAAAWH